MATDEEVDVLIVFQDFENILKKNLCKIPRSSSFQEKKMFTVVYYCLNKFTIAILIEFFLLAYPPGDTGVRIFLSEPRICMILLI